MKFIFDSNQPIYMQIISHIKRQLINGTLAPGERIASVRDLAVEYGVNPNTMQKALAELERAGYLFSERTAGRCVTTDKSLIKQLRDLEHDVIMDVFVKQMGELGISPDTLPVRLADYLRERVKT